MLRSDDPCDHVVARTHEQRLTGEQSTRTESECKHDAGSHCGEQAMFANGDSLGSAQHARKTSGGDACDDTNKQSSEQIAKEQG